MLVLAFALLVLLVFLAVLLVFALVAVPVLAWMALARVNALPSFAARAHNQASRQQETTADDDNEMLLHRVLALCRPTGLAQESAANIVGQQVDSDAENPDNLLPRSAPKRAASWRTETNRRSR